MSDRNMVNITITMTREERKALKQLALDEDTTASALIREWLKEHIEQQQEVSDHGETCVISGGALQEDTG